MTIHHWWLQPDLSGVTTAFCFRLQSLCQCNRWHITYVSDLFGPLNCILRRTSFTLCLFWNLVVLPFTECLKKGCLADYIWYKGLTSPFYYSKCPLPAVMQPLSSCLKSPWLPPQGWRKSYHNPAGGHFTANLILSCYCANGLLTVWSKICHNWFSTKLT